MTALATIENETYGSVIDKLNRDIRTAAKTLGRDEVRFLVDTYYQMQEARKASGNQRLSLEKSGEPNRAIEWIAGQFDTLETRTKSLLAAYSESTEHGRWATSIYGIGPVISAGLLAHIDMEGTETVSRIWRYAGLDPTVRWEKGKKRPWNASLKTLCWKIGDSFVKFSNREQCVYGRLYRERKAIEVERNERRAFADQAERVLTEKNIRAKETRAHYEDGRLPPGHIDMRARRWAVKMFLSHWFQVGYEIENGRAPARPYVIEHMGHADLTYPPNWPME